MAGESLERFIEARRVTVRAGCREQAQRRRSRYTHRPKVTRLPAGGRDEQGGFSPPRRGRITRAVPRK
jgi:hypothetical protein